MEGLGYTKVHTLDTYLAPASFILLSYCLGGIPTGVILSGFLGDIDIMEAGSRSIGATNVARLLGKGPAIITFALDLMKGVIPALLAPSIFRGDPIIVSIASFAPILGHCHSPFLGLRGGKGVATGLGMVIPLCPFSALSGAILWGAFFLIFRKSSVSSLSGVAGALAIAILIPPCTTWLPLFLLSALFIISRHRENIRRLIRGEEKRLSV